jgi:hypothetical protein
VENSSARILVLVHPRTTDTYWIQQPPLVAADGSWRATCYFGTDEAGLGEECDIIAVAIEQRLLGILAPAGLPTEPGATVKEIPRALSRSNVVTVRRNDG